LRVVADAVASRHLRVAIETAASHVDAELVDALDAVAPRAGATA